MHPGLADIVADALPEPAASLATEARFLMCPPRHYAVSYSINPWMNPVSWNSGGSALHEEAEQQWFALHDTLLALGAAIDFIDPEPNLPDLVFTANAAIVLDGKALLARFRLPERQGEEPIFGAALLALRERIEIDSIMEMPEGIWLEGACDCIWDAVRPGSSGWASVHARTARRHMSFRKVSASNAWHWSCPIRASITSIPLSVPCPRAT